MITPTISAKTGGSESEFQRRRGALGEKLRHRQTELVGDAEFEMQRIPDEVRELHERGIIQPERLAQACDLLVPACRSPPSGSRDRRRSGT